MKPLIRFIQQDTSKAISDLVIVAFIGLIAFAAAYQYDLFEQIFILSREHESWQVDECFTVAVILMVCFGIYAFRRWQEALVWQKGLGQKNSELQKALKEVKTLEGILPICASCKRIRDGEGRWHQVEVYVRDHTDADFSHGLCPDCAQKLYPDFFKE